MYCGDEVERELTESRGGDRSKGGNEKEGVGEDNATAYLGLGIGRLLKDERYTCPRLLMLLELGQHLLRELSLKS